MRNLIFCHPKTLAGMRPHGSNPVKGSPEIFLHIVLHVFLVFVFVPAATADSTGKNTNEYRIGVEDVLNIHIWREETISRTVPVRLDGKISLPLLDDIQAAGKTPLELKHEITDRLRQYIEDPIVTVIVAEHNNFKVFITGQVRTPGMYRLRSKGSLLQVIPLSGGFTEWANQKKIVLIRNREGQEEKKTINYIKLIETGSDFELQPGDVIVVP